MPVILLPIHFDRDQALRIPSCQRSIVLRPFCTQDFMTGIPAIPGKQLPLDVSIMKAVALTCCNQTELLLFDAKSSIT